MKRLLCYIVVLLSLFSFKMQAQPLFNNGAHLGKYGLERYLNGRSDYVKYIGQKVIVLQSGSEMIGSEYAISKMVGGVDFMTITLEQIEQKTTKKMAFSASGESETEYYITDETTLPLLLIDKFNRDKHAFVGRNYPIGSEGENSIGVIANFVMHCYNKSYPIPSYEITKEDGTKVYIPFDDNAYIIPNNEVLAANIRLKFGVVPEMVIEDDGSVTFSSVIIADGKSKDELFVTAMDFLVSQYNNAQKVIQYSDKDAGIIMGKGCDKLKDDLLANHTVKIECRDGRMRVRYTFDNYSYKGMSVPIANYSPFIGNNATINMIFGMIVSSVNLSIREIDSNLKSGSSKIDSEDW